MAEASARERPDALDETHQRIIANLGWKEAMRRDPHLAQGLNVHAGRVTYPAVASELGYELLPIAEAIA